MLPTGRDACSPCITTSGARRCVQPRSRSLRPGVQRVQRLQLRAALQDQDEGEDLEAEFARVARVAQSERVKAEGSRLELAWQVSKWQRRKPLVCTCCQGSGLSDCQFCHGTGAMTIGEQLFCSLTEGCRGCPACKRKGQIKCKACKGTGHKAGWMP